MDAQPGPTLGDLGEQAILSAIFPVLQSDSPYLLLGPGDDCAVLAAPDSRYVVSTDLIVEGHDFLQATSTARDIAGKAAAQNLADIAAMGAVPTAIVVGLVAPDTTPMTWVREFTAGLAERCAEAGVVVAGGDLSAGPVLMVSITVFGDLQGRRPVRRDGARPGDVLTLAGTVGLAAAGLAVLRAGRPELEVMFSDEVAVQRAARPPLAAGPEAAHVGVTAMIDVSDGLLRDAGRIAGASSVGVEIDSAATILADATARLTEIAAELGVERPTAAARAWVLAGGEDHGLLATFPPDVTLPAAFRPIGRVCEAAADAAVTVLGVDELPDLGFDHFEAGS